MKKLNVSKSRHYEERSDEVIQKIKLDCHGVCTPRNDVTEPNEVTRDKLNDKNSSSYRPNVLTTKKCAFTLAEVLITLGIIGVVAAITLPALITNIQDRIKEKRVQNIQQKFSKATDKMLATSGLNGYESTLDFVNELKNHLSIAKICENDELRNCWPTDTVTLGDGKEWNIADTKKAKQLKMENNDSQEWSDTVGLITGDGTSMILSYNTKCDQDPVATPSWDKNKSNSTSCIAAVYDWNGSSKPNQFGTDRADVLALNAGGLGSSCAIEVNGKCFGVPFIADPISQDECNQLWSEGGWGIKACYDEFDYWAGAAKHCGGASKMASVDDLAMIASKIYVGNPTIDAMDSVEGLTYKAGTATSLGFPEPEFAIWPGRLDTDSGKPLTRVYAANETFRVFANRGVAGTLTLCVVE